MSRRVYLLGVGLALVALALWLFEQRAKSSHRLATVETVLGPNTTTKGRPWLTCYKTVVVSPAPTLLDHIRAWLGW
jgi:hypothetical protein